MQWFVVCVVRYDSDAGHCGSPPMLLFLLLLWRWEGNHACLGSTLVHNFLLSVGLTNAKVLLVVCPFGSKSKYMQKKTSLPSFQMINLKKKMLPQQPRRRKVGVVNMALQPWRLQWSKHRGDHKATIICLHIGSLLMSIWKLIDLAFYWEMKYVILHLCWH